MKTNTWSTMKIWKALDLNSIVANLVLHLTTLTEDPVWISFLWVQFKGSKIQDPIRYLQTFHCKYRFYVQSNDILKNVLKYSSLSLEILERFQVFLHSKRQLISFWIRENLKLQSIHYRQAEHGHQDGHRKLIRIDA